MRLERFGEGRALTHLDGSMPENVATDSSGPRSRSRLSLVSDDYEDEDAKLTLSWDTRSGKLLPPVGTMGQSNPPGRATKTNMEWNDYGPDGSVGWEERPSPNKSKKRHGQKGEKKKTEKE